jgi:VWFA-related protein
MSAQSDRRFESLLPGIYQPWLLLASVFLQVGLGTDVAVQQTFRGRVDLVRLNVVVKDDQGQPVSGLMAADFRILDNRRQIIPDVITEARVSGSHPPGWMRSYGLDVAVNDDLETKRLVAIVIDDGRMSPFERGRRNVQDVARAVIERLGPDDLACVVFTADNSGAQDFTRDRQRLLDAVKGMRVGDTTYPPIFTVYSLDVISRVASSLGKTGARQKLIVYIGWGHQIGLQRVGAAKHPRPKNDVFGMAARADGVLREAQRSGVAIYAVDPLGSERNLKLLASSRFLANMSEFTGGFAIAGGEDFRAGLDQMFDVTGHYYVLGFSPPADAVAGVFRGVEVGVTNPKLTVQAPGGYYTPTRRAIETSEPPHRKGYELEDALRGPLPVSGLPLTLALVPYRRILTDAAYEPHVNVTLGVRRPIRAGFQLQTEVRVFDGEGRRQIASGRHQHVLQPLTGGVGLSQVRMDIPLKAGRYAVRVGAYAPDTDEVGSVFGSVVIPELRDSLVIHDGFVQIDDELPGQGVDPRPSSQREFSTRSAAAFVTQLCSGTTSASGNTAHLELKDSSGRAVATPIAAFRVPDIPARQCVFFDVPLPLAQLSSGNYLFQVVFDDKAQTRKSLVFSIK